MCHVSTGLILLTNNQTNKLGNADENIISLAIFYTCDTYLFTTTSSSSIQPTPQWQQQFEDWFTDARWQSRRTVWKFANKVDFAGRPRLQSSRWDAKHNNNNNNNNRIYISPYTIITSEALAAGRISVQW